MQCPRCGTENQDDRSSCWNCFGALRAQAGVKPPKKEKPKKEPRKGKQTKTVEPIPEPVLTPPEAPSERDLAAVERLFQNADKSEAERVIELAEPEPEPESDFSTGFFLPKLGEPEQAEPEPEIEEAPALVEEFPLTSPPEPEPEMEPEEESPVIDLTEEALPADEFEFPKLEAEQEAPFVDYSDLAPAHEIPSLAPPPKPEPELVVAESPVEEEEDLGVHEPKVFDLDEAPEDETPVEEPVAESNESLAPSFLGGPEEEEDLGVHEPRVFDIGQSPEVEAPVEEPIAELETEDLGVHEPKVFDLGEAPEEEKPEEKTVAEPEAIQADLSIHEPEAVDLGEAPEEDPAVEETVAAPESAKSDLWAYEPKVFDLGVVPKAPPAPTPAVEKEPSEVAEPAFEVAPEIEPEPETVAKEETPEVPEPAFEVTPAPTAPPPTIEELAYDFDLESEAESVEPVKASDEIKEETVSDEDGASMLYGTPNHVPGLAEPDAHTEQPKIEAPELPVLDVESVEPQKPQPAPEEGRPIRQRRRSALPGFMVTIILLLLSTWAFMNAYPAPGTVARDFVLATDSMMAGDTSMLSRVASADSQSDIAQMSKVFQPFKARRLQIRMSPQEVVDRKIDGNEANVVVLTNVGIPNTVQAQGRLTVALVKEGSAFRKQWKVDLAKTGASWKAELPQLLKSLARPAKGKQ